MLERSKSVIGKVVSKRGNCIIANILDPIVSAIKSKVAFRNFKVNVFIRNFAGTEIFRLTQIHVSNVNSSILTNSIFNAIMILFFLSDE